jgi:hypothetical protein
MPVSSRLAISATVSSLELVSMARMMRHWRAN